MFKLLNASWNALFIFASFISRGWGRLLLPAPLQANNYRTQMIIES